jgi:hypothetical protein
LKNPRDGVIAGAEPPAAAAMRKEHDADRPAGQPEEALKEKRVGLDTDWALF